MQTRRTTKTWKVKSSWNRRAKEFSPGAVGNAAWCTAHAWEGRGLGRGLWGGSPGQRTAQTKAYEGHDPGQYCAARDEMAQGDQNTSRHVSPGEARHLWRRRSVSPLHGRRIAWRDTHLYEAFSCPWTSPATFDTLRETLREACGSAIARPYGPAAWYWPSGANGLTPCSFRLVRNAQGPEPNRVNAD